MWITLTENDVDKVLSAKEKAETMNLFKGTETLADLIACVVLEVRSYVGNCTQLSTNPLEIPDEAKLVTLTVIRHRMITRLAGGDALLTEARYMEYNNAMDWLKRAARCELRIEGAPDASCPTATTDSSGNLVGDNYGSAPLMPIC